MRGARAVFADNLSFNGVPRNFKNSKIKKKCLENQKNKIRL